MPKNKKCIKCGGQVFTFDSMMESNRYLYLKEDPDISRLTVQKSFTKSLHLAKYNNGYLTNKEPQFQGFSDKIIERTEYKLDFAYYDRNTLMGWVAEEFKPCPEKMDTEHKRKINDAFDQHQMWGHFCYSYPSKCKENNRLKNYKRLFVSRSGNSVKYLTYDEMFK